MPELAYLNGDIMPIDQALVPIEDRGYQFGDAVYEFVESFHGRLFCLDRHLQRLERSMRELQFPEVSVSGIGTAVQTLLERSTFERAGIYIQVSRGVAPRLHAFPDGLTVQVVMTVREMEDTPETVRQNGGQAQTMQDFRWGRCDIKTVQLLPAVLAKRSAEQSGLMDTIFVSREGIVREATSSNTFAVSDGRLMTHPLNNHILPGITRGVIIELARDANIPVAEDIFNTDELYRADEVFLSATVVGVVPLVAVDRHTIADGRVGPVTRRLLEAFERITRPGPGAEKYLA